MTMTSKDVSAMLSPALDQQRRRRLDQFLESLHPLRAAGAVDDAMVAGDGAAHHRGDCELAVLDHGALLAHSHREDAALRRVDDGLEMPDAVHAEIGDREGAALELRERDLGIRARAGKLALAEFQ